MKQSITRSLFVSVLLVFALTTAWAQKSVLDESFTGKALPNGWSTASSFWKFQDGNANFQALVENGKDTLFTPLLSLSELDNKPSVAITYQNVKNGDKVNELKVLYRAAVDADWQEWKVFDAATDGQQYVKDVLPDGLTNVQIALAGAYLDGAETRVYRLAIENKTEATEAPTGLRVEDLTTTSAMLMWEACSSPKFYQYNLKVSTSKMTDMSVEADVLNKVNWTEPDPSGEGEIRFTDEFQELKDLTPDQEYWFYVQYDCGDGDVSPWAENSFRTSCEAIKAPFAEDFEEKLSNCFTIIEGSTAAEVSGEYAYNSQKAFKSNSAKGKYNYLILPEFNGDVKNFQVSFMAAAVDGGNTYARTVTIGVCTEATAESFTEVKTLDLPKGRTWEQIVVTLKAYAGAGKYIAFRFGNEDKENRLFVDDIHIENASACPKPMFVQVSEITPSQAKIAWTETGDATEWNLVLSTKLLVDPEDIEPDASKGEFAGSISKNPYTATNLKANTTYFAYLQAGCGSSEWTSAVEFKTSRPVTYPYSEHFDRMNPDAYTNTTAAIPDGWVFDDRGNNPSYTNYYDKQYTSDTYRPYVTTTQNHEQTAYVNASLFLRGASGTSATSTNYTSIAMLPAMPKAVNTMMVTFWARGGIGNQTVKVGVANTQTNDLPQGKQLGENITEVGEVTAIKDEWKQFKVLLTSYTGEGRYIVFYMKPGTSTPNVYIDDIEIDDAPDCNSVTDLTAEATGIDKATVTWADASSNTSWTIKVSSTQIDPASEFGDKIAAQTVSSKSYELTGLSMGGTYYIYVSPSCGDMWQSTTVTTLVGLQVPYYNDFQTENQGSNATRGPKNWTLGNINITAAVGTQTNIPYVYNTAMTGAPAGVEKPNLYFYHSNSATNTGAYAIMPELLNANVKDLKMSFYGSYNSTTVTANYSKGMLRIGVVDNISDINKTNAFTKVTEVATVYCSAPKITELFTVDFSGYAGSGKYIVFYSDTAKYNYFMLDNLTISLATDPQPVSDVAASEQTETTAKLTWTENGKATKWEVRVFDAAQEDPEAGTPVWSNANLTSKQATVTGLTHSTQYFAYVRSIQDNGNGAWGSVSFYSECGAWAVPFYEDWNKYETGGTTNNTLHPCYNVEHSTASTWPYVRLYTGASVYHESKTNLMYLTAGTGKVCQLEFPKLDAPINTLQMELEASPYSTSFGAKFITFFGVVTSDGIFHEVAQRTNSAKAWEPWVVDFSAYDGEEGVIAIRLDPTMAATASGTSATTQYVFIENVSIKIIPQCKQIQPNDMEATEIGTESAKITWPAAEASKWNLKVSTVALDDPSTATADVFDGEMTTTTKALTGLDDNTKFYVYVQTVRPDKECVGEWSRALIFKTLCKPQSFPYYEDFQSYETTGAGNLPDCSTICGEDAEHSYISTKGTGNKAVYINQKAKEHKNYFVFPALNTDDVRKLQLNMQVWVGTTATTTYRYQIGIMTDPNDPSTFVSLHNEELLGSSDPYDRAYKFDNYQGDETGTKFGGYIAISPRDYSLTNGNTGYTTMYIDNVTIDFIETCAKPVDLTSSEMGITDVTLTWTTDDATANHRVRIFASADANPETDAFVAEKVVATKEAKLEGLIGNTTYYAFVRKECGGTDGNSKWSSAYMFKTNCPEFQPLPYEEGFEAFEANAIPDCWTPLDNTTNGKSRVGGTSTYAISGSRYLNVNYGSVGSSSGNSYYKSSIVTPKLEVANMVELLLCFDARTGSGTGSLKIEVVSDNTSNAEAIALTTITDITTTPKKIYLKLADYYTSVQPYQYLRFTPETQGVSIYVDNMIFTKDLNLIFPVDALKAQAVTENTIKFSFTEPTPSVTQWQIAYVAAGGNIADATVQTIDATEYTIEGLAANTGYDIYVRGNVDGDEWVGPLTVTTIQAPTPLPYSTGFEDDADKWVIYKAKNVQGDPYPNYFTIGAADNCGAIGDKALFITDDGTSYTYHTKDAQGEIGFSNAWATRNINIEAAGTYKVAFKVKVPANKDNESDYATAHLFPAGATILGDNATMLNGTVRKGTAVTDVPASNIYSLMGKTYHENEWIWTTKTLDVEEAGIYTLAIFWYNASVGAQYGQAIAVDSVIVEEYLCTTPKNIEFTNRGANEVSLKWFSGRCKNFEYVLSRYANLGNPNLIDEEDKVAYGTLSEGPQVTLTDLVPQTKYSFYVRTICEDGYTDWVEFDFETPCGKYDLPYTEGFYAAPECWILTSASTTTQKYQTPDMSEAEVWSCLQLNNGGIAVLPELNVDLKNVEVEVALFNSTNLGAVSLGVMDNTYDASTFKQVAFFQTNNKLTGTSSGNPYVLEKFNKMLNLYQGTGKVLAIKNATSNAIYVKYVTLTELPDCVKPQQVEMTYITDNSATVNWIAGTEEKWEIKVNDGEPFEVTEQPYKLTGLEQGTIYEVAVRALCDAENTSDWSLPTTFQTECAVNPLPLFEDFSGLKKPAGTTDLVRAELTCWDNMVTTGKIEEVFQGHELPFKAPSNIYAGQSWVSNWLSKLGDYAQLQSYHGVYQPTYRYKWFISPQYAIEGKAVLSFDIRHCGNTGQKVELDEGRFMIAISTDNGASWKKADATQIKDIDTVYTTKSISLDQYVGKSIRIAFYDENLAGSSSKASFLYIDNVRMNCMEEYTFEGNACQGYDYNGYGFSIPKLEIPAAGESRQYTRFAKAEGEGCDSTIVLTLTTHITPEVAPIYASICRGEVYEFGPFRLTEPSSSNPGGEPYKIRGETVFGCDSTIYLYLEVNESDTTNMTSEPIEIMNSELPYKVDEVFTIPEDARVGVKFDTIVKIGESCSFNKYSVLINRCMVDQKYSATICESEVGYINYGFSLVKDDLPAPGKSKDFVRNAEHTGMDICDSIVTLTLTVHKNDTTPFTDAICQSATGYEGNGFTLTQAELPAPGETAMYYRTEIDKVYDCDSVISLELTMYKNDTTSYTDALCQSETAYEGYGFSLSQTELPAPGETQIYYRSEKDQLTGCDSIITLQLTTLTYDTVAIPIVTIPFAELPYKVDDYYTVPIEAQVGEAFEVVVRLGETNCTFHKYTVFVSDCVRTAKYDATICEDQATFEDFGFAIDKADMPTPGSSKDFNRFAKDLQGCDSVITLSLSVLKADTTFKQVNIQNIDLPYVVDEYYTVPADAAIGEQFVVTVKTDAGDCSFSTYEVMVTKCKIPVEYEDAICSDQVSYEGYGFTLTQDELPAPGESKVYNRNALDAVGCDSVITFTLSVVKNDTTFITVAIDNTQLPYEVDNFYTVPAGTPIDEPYELVIKTGDCMYNKYLVSVIQCTRNYRYAETLCEDQKSYEGYGFTIEEADMPAIGESKSFNRSNMSEAGCDSLITLTLFAQANDTINKPVEILNTQLPYTVDAYYTVPEDAPIGETFVEVRKAGDNGCTYYKYIVTISQCKQSYEFEDAICDGQAPYQGYGFVIEATDLPAVGESKPFNRNAKDEVGCDSIITLTLTVWKNDTIDHLPPYEIKLSELPFIVDGVEILPADTEIGEYSIVFPSESDECSYDRYFYNVVDDEDGLFDINAGIRNIVIYDVLGHKVATVAESSEIMTLDLPQGVYMIHTLTQNGEAFCGKYIAK